MRTKAHNAALKKYRLINERKAALKKAGAPASSLGRGCWKPKAVIAPGTVFGKLVAVDERDLGDHHTTWLWLCTCGAHVLQRLANVRYTLRTTGDVTCTACFKRAHPERYALAPSTALGGLKPPP